MSLLYEWSNAYSINHFVAWCEICCVAQQQEAVVPEFYDPLSLAFPECLLSNQCGAVIVLEGC